MWLIDSSIGRKVIMSVTGLFLILFLTFHSIMNVTVLFSTGVYNAICEFLGANWYAVAASLVLAMGFVLHILYALYLTWLNYKARGNDRYALTKRQEGVAWSSKNMFVLGLIIFGFLALHLYQFWFKMQYAELTGVQTGDYHPADGAAYIIQLFSQPLYCILYIIWLTALWFHLTHGIWSALQSIGMNNKTWLPRLKCFANAYSTFVILLFMAIPVLFLFGYRPI